MGGVVPSSCINGLVEVPTWARPIEFPSLDVSGDDDGSGGGAVGGGEHGVGGVGVIEDGTEGGNVGGSCFAEDEGV